LDSSSGIKSANLSDSWASAARETSGESVCLRDFSAFIWSLISAASSRDLLKRDSWLRWQA
jgi:hypothetical protein